MNRSNTQPILSIIRCSLVVGLLGVVGCADSVTYSRDTRNRGISNYNTGNHAEAAATFQQAIRQDPRDYRSHYYLGATYEAMNLHQQAIGSYKASLDVMRLTHEGRADANFRNRVLDALAGAVARSDERHIELDALESAVRSNPDAEGHFLLAKAYRRSGDPDSALNSYNRALMMDEKNFLIVKEYGLYLEQLGMKDRAFPLIRQGYVMQPHDHDLDLALRRYGLVPGPSLVEEHELQQPLVPKGPVQVRGFGTENRLQRMKEEETSGSPQTVQVPRD